MVESLKDIKHTCCSLPFTSIILRPVFLSVTVRMINFSEISLLVCVDAEIDPYI